MEEEFMKFLRENIPCSEDDCKNCETNTVHNTISKEGTFQEDNIDDLEKFVHTILDSDDQEDIECKKIYNDALEQNKEMHILHNNMEAIDKLDKEKLEEMKHQYDPKSEKIFESTWEISDLREDDTIVKQLYEDLSNLNIKGIQDSDKSNSSSNNTVI